MGKICLNEQEVAQVERVTSHNHSQASSLGLETAIDEITSKHPSASGVEQQICHQICDRESYPCDNKISTADYISSVSLLADLTQDNTNNDVVEHSSSESSSPFSKTTLLRILSDLNSSEFSIQNLDHEDGTGATSPNPFTSKYASMTAPVSVNISIPEQCTFCSVQGTAKMGTLLQSWLFFQLAAIDRTMSQAYPRKFNNMETTFSELPNSQSRLCDSLSPTVNLASMENETPESKYSKIHVTYLDPMPKCLYQSTSSSSEKSSVFKGLLQVKWKCGTPYFLFTGVDECSDIYVANPCKVESNSDKVLDFIYSFYSWTSSTKESRSYNNSTSDSVGKMEVSSSLILDSNNSKIIETEFVLFCADQGSREMHSPVSAPTRRKGFSKMVADLIRTSNSFKHGSNSRSGESRPKIEDILQKLSQTKPSNSNKPVAQNFLDNDSLLNHELIAIVIKDYKHDTSGDARVGGWGLMFLEKNTTNHDENLVNPLFDSLENDINYQGEKGASARSISVLIPAGLHGRPSTGVGSPASLIERWRSGGRCDCGGWDAGCPLTVLSNKIIVSEAFPPVESLKNHKSVDFFVEGKDGEPGLRMFNTNEDEYIIYFQQNLSALQSFSLAVAVIHTQTSVLYPSL